MYEIEFTPEANEDLKLFRKFEQKQILDETEHQLKYEPNVATHNRKEMDPNDVAGWELRIGKFRVFYNVDEETRTVSVEAVGFKVGSILFIRGEKERTMSAIITVPTRAKTLNDLLRKARRKEIVLESADGERFVLASIQGWEGFEVGEDEDITKNKKLMSRLANRRSGGKRIPLAKARAQLGLS